MQHQGFLAMIEIALADFFGMLDILFVNKPALALDLQNTGACRRNAITAKTRTMGWNKLLGSFSVC